MKPLPRSIRFLLATLGVVVPPLAARVAIRMFWHLGKPAPVRAQDAAVHERARVTEVEFEGKKVAVYSWGSGQNTLLLVHGWRSRASRFATLVEALERDDRTVIAFDAPGNGASTGTRTNLMEYAGIITALGARYGGFDAVVAHSSGVLASFVAIRDGVRADRIVSISGAYSWATIFGGFVEIVGLPRRAAAIMHRRILSTTFAHLTDAPRHFIAELEPTDTVTPLLVIHDELDRAVDVEQGRTIADAHNGPTDLIVTRGLGHARILDNPGIVALVRDFVSGEPDEHETDEHQGHQESRDEVQAEEPSPAAVR